MTLRVLILSDLHAFCPKDEGTSTEDVSFLRASEASSPGHPDPILQIRPALEAQRLKVDWILCPGDLADKADPAAQAFVWRRLEDLRKDVGARVLIATAGNHDIDSRLVYSNFDAKGALQNLAPPFPGLGEDVCDRYWSRNFHIFQSDGALLLNLNSSAFHGFNSGAKDAPKEYLHGRVSQRTIDSIKSTLSNCSARLYILLTHHHPEKDDSIEDDDYSAMLLGSKLLSEIQEVTNSNWLVLHGHQHYPRVTYGRGTSFRPVIFSAGSISANLRGDQALSAVNQFYHVSVETDEVQNVNGPCGIIRAWHWAGRSTWVPSPGNHRIPDHCGFGHRPSISAAASQIRGIVEASTRPFVTYPDLCSDIPELRYLLKETFDRVVEDLQRTGTHVARTEPYIDSLFMTGKNGGAP